MPNPNWSRPLTRPLVIPEVMKLVTLADASIQALAAQDADVRELIERHLPAHFHGKGCCDLYCFTSGRAIRSLKRVGGEASPDFCEPCRGLQLFGVLLNIL